MKIEKLKDSASNEDVIKKINEIIDVVNELQKKGDDNVYIGERPKPYDTNALNRFRRK